jgi:uncharacterized OsmC-like protein
MQPFPHIYRVVANGGPVGEVSVATSAAPNLVTAAPVEFDGPGNAWSPESLLCAAVADCFVLTFRSIARAARFDWLELRCRVEGKLERIEGQSRFTHFSTSVDITVPLGSDLEHAIRLLEKAEKGCLVSNSLSAGRSLEIQVAERKVPTAEAAN